MLCCACSRFNLRACHHGCHTRGSVVVFFCGAALLAEAERLGQERVEVQRQAEKDCGGMASRLRMLEQALEEQHSRAHQLEEQHRLQTEDLQQHIHALEKQLKHHRQFIDVSAFRRPLALLFTINRLNTSFIFKFMGLVSREHGNS